MTIRLKVKDDPMYVDNPRLEDNNKLYYSGCGCTWDTDLDGNRYYLLYNPAIITQFQRDMYPRLRFRDIINEEGRIQKIIRDYINDNTTKFELTIINDNQVENNE